MTNCESLAAAITTTPWAENVPVKSAFPVTHNPLSQQPPPEEEEEDPEMCPGKTSRPQLSFGLRSRSKKSHLIPSKSSFQSSNGSLGSPFVPWTVLAVYHIHLTN